MKICCRYWKPHYTVDGGRTTEGQGQATCQVAEDGADVLVDARSWREDGSTYATDDVPCSTSGEYKWFSLHVPSLNLVSHMQNLLFHAESIGSIKWWASWPRFVAMVAVATSASTCGCGILVWTFFIWVCLYLHLWTTCSCWWTILNFICICGLFIVADEW